MTPAALAPQARLLHLLGERDGAVPLSEAMDIVPAAERSGLDGAVTALQERELLELGGDGVLRRGRRGSLLSAARVRERRRGGRYGVTAEVQAVVDSTNDVVLARAIAGARPGLVVAAELQTSGRGTKGRSFLSPPGLGVWSTVLLEAPADPAVAPRWSLVAALAAAAAIEHQTGVRPGLKWPNDVRIGGRKVCGVLVEARSIAGEMFVVAGIGCNVHHRPDEFPPELRTVAGGVEERTGRNVDRSALLASLAEELEARMGAERAGGIDLAASWARFDELAGRDVEVRLGDESFVGRADGIEDDGRLRVRGSGADTRTVRSAHATVSVRMRESVERR